MGSRHSGNEAMIAIIIRRYGIKEKSALEFANSVVEERKLKGIADILKLTRKDLDEHFSKCLKACLIKKRESRHNKSLKSSLVTT